MGHTCQMHDEQPNATHRGTGRPATIDPEAVAAVALRLFEARGYESVSMEDIAAAAGIGRKSLYRYFPNKAALVWGGLDEAVSVGRKSLVEHSESREPSSNPAIILTIAGLSVAHQIPDLEITRGRLLLIARYEELSALAYGKLRDQRVAMCDYLISVGILEEYADSLAAAYSAALFAGWMRWARGTAANPQIELQIAFDTVRIPNNFKTWQRK